MTARLAADLVMLGEKIFYLPCEVMDVECVARTTKGKRCRNGLESVDYCGLWRQLRSSRGVITVYDLSFLDAQETGRWLSQRCVRHHVPAVADFQAPQWQPFDPDGAHAHMVTSLDELVRQAERGIRDGATAAWEKWHGPDI